MDRFIYSLLLLAPAFGLLTREPPVPSAATRSTAPEERWFDARLNQFDASNKNTFPMRFYYNNEFQSSNTSSIVIFVGGEWQISAGWLQAGLAYELAGQIQAGLFYTEHRYYGETRPTEETHTSDLRFLTVDQALADLAQFIEYVKSDHFEDGIYKSSKVALVGCSYAGSMATWMRLAYPHLVDVAFSDSGPLQAQEDFPEYLEVISDALEVQGSPTCLQAVRESMEALNQLLHSSGGSETVSQLFRTCSPLTTTPLDLATFHWFGITETFAYLVQYATPGDIQAACTVLTAANTAPVVRLANWITSQPWTYPCIESRYMEVVAAHTNTSYDATQSVMRLWTYQTCVEYGWYQTTTSDRQPFLASIPLEYFHQMCKDFFGNSFDEEFLQYGIERTNTFFGGFQLPDHVVSVAGGHDPWAPMGPTTDHGHELAPVYVVPYVSHCRAIQPLAASESEELARTKRHVSNFLAERLIGEPVYEIEEELGEDSSAYQHLVSVIVMALGLYIAL